MADDRIVYQRGDYIVSKTRTGYYLYNRKRLYQEEHTHIKTLETCEDFIDMMYRRKIPDSKYLRESVIRVCKDKKYVNMVKHKIEKDKQKPKFIRINKGVRKWP